MSKYRVNHTYRGPVNHQYVVLEQGTEVDLDDDTAAWIERDSPGVLSKPRQAKQKPDRQDRGSHDRSG